MLAFSPISLWSLQGQTQTLGQRQNVERGTCGEGGRGLLSPQGKGSSFAASVGGEGGGALMSWRRQPAKAGGPC